MICIEIASPGQPEVLRPVERPDPVPAPGEVLIRVAAAGINRPDVMQRQGHYPPPPGASDIPGLEVAGGGYATKCVAPAPQCLPVPSTLDLVSAAAIPETFFTVWTNVFDRGRLQPGESALFHGGASGIGTTSIQLAAARGSRVFATAGSDEKCRACEALGAERAVNYRTGDFVEAVRELTGGRGVDLVLDIVGGSYVDRNLAALAMDGRLVVIGFMEGKPSATVDLRRILGRRLTITGSALRPRTVDEKGAIASSLRREVWPLLERGIVRPVVYRTFPLAEAAAAHRLMESSEHVGKIVLIC